MGNIPSKKRMVEAFGVERGSALRLYFEKGRRNGMSYRLGAANVILEGYGVEYIEHRGKGIHYVNMGDSYATTIMRVDGKLRIGDWGSIVER
jgi:hypothetical protein